MAYSHSEDDLVCDEGDSYLSPLINFYLAESRTDLGRSHGIDRELYSLYPNSLLPQNVVTPRRSRLHLSIPGVSSNASSTVSPQSDSPETPVSLSSPIAGVVDLTSQVKTISTDAVAQGGLSDIYKGEWCQSDRDCDSGRGKEEIVVVAIKLLRILTTKDLDGVRARKRLNREVYVWHRLEHPNIVKLFGTSYHMSGRPAMVMRWYDNGNAAEYLAKKNPDADRKKLILDVARGLAYLHTNKPPIIHADLKGNNVLITDDGRGVLCDFGLSQVVEDLGRPAGLTLSNPDVGPLRWQPPEFLEDIEEPATLTSDVWSYGCTAFELLTSLKPYPHRPRDGQVIRDMQIGIKPSGSSTEPTLLPFGSRIINLLNKCWAFTPSERPTITDVEAQLESICGHPATQEI